MHAFAYVVLHESPNTPELAGENSSNKSSKPNNCVSIVIDGHFVSKAATNSSSDTPKVFSNSEH